MLNKKSMAAKEHELKVIDNLKILVGAQELEIVASQNLVYQQNALFDGLSKE